jgi:hypothetical protein
MNEDISGKGSFVSFWDPSAGVVPYFESSKADWTNQFYGEYKMGRWCIDAEYRRYLRNQLVLNKTSLDISDVRAWYVSGTYRVNKKVRLGSYYSHYTLTDVVGGLLTTIAPNQIDTTQPTNHIYDKVVSARLDLNHFWNVKIEGHFMDGFANAGYPAGFYVQQNRQGFKPNTNALVVKTGFHF